MKKNNLFTLLISLFLIFIIIFAWVEFSPIIPDTEDKIIAPNNNQIPIQGTWQIDQFVTLDDTPSEAAKAEKWLGVKGVFSKELAAFGEEMCTNPTYSIRKVNTSDYFFHTHKINIAEFNIKETDSYVIAVSYDKNFFYEFVKIDEQLLIKIDNSLFYLNKIADQGIAKKEDSTVTQRNQKDIVPPSSEEGEEKIASGLLFGLRNDANMTYRTLWISCENRELKPVLESSGLFVPRKQGFWNIGTIKHIKNNKVEDILFAYPVEDEFEDYLTYLNLDAVKVSTLRKILFVGNDYIALESIQAPTWDNSQQRTLQVLPIGQIYSSEGIRLSDLSGNNLPGLFAKSASSYLSNHGDLDLVNTKNNLDEKNFTLKRKNGKWIMIGRINYTKANGKEAYIDFNINQTPPSQMVNYDTLSLSWNTIKSKIPEAIDAYTSPNEDLALIVCENAVYIYAINDLELSLTPLHIINLHEGERVVMAEWATGDYVAQWQSQFRGRKGI